MKYRISKRVEKAWMWLAWHLPKTLRMWVVVKAFSEAWAKPPYNVPDDIGYSEVMKGFR